MGSRQDYLRLQKEVIDIAKGAGRDPSEIEIIAVSKNFSWNEVEPVYTAGCRNFGENRIQEALEKQGAAPHDVQWHFIGALQTNKVRKAVGRFAWIHSVDSVELAKKISQVGEELGFISSILLQVNISGEKTRTGICSRAFAVEFS